MTRRPGPFSASLVAKIAAALGVEGEVDLEQLRIGMGVELEHGRADPLTNVTDDDPLLTAKIALAHLRELPGYYVRLAAMEAGESRALVVGDVMTRKLLTVTPDQPLTVADRLLRVQGVSGVPVVERDGRLVGVLSRTDLVALAAGDPVGAWHGRAVRTAMTSPAVTISPGATLSEAAARMEEHQVHRLVVVEERGGRPVGILSTMDLVRVVAGGRRSGEA
jgi:CBS domain-containing protein